MNELLAELPPICRLLFIGLWTIADREGRLEDRPKRIKAEILPYDECDINQLLSQLSKAEFITRYVVDNKRFVEVKNFKKHQHFHVREPASILPAPPQHRTSTGQAPDKPDAKTPLSFSFSLSSNTHTERSTIPKSNYTEKAVPANGKKKSLSGMFLDEWKKFNSVLQRYPNQVGVDEAFKEFQHTVKTEDDLITINQALDKYLKSRRVKRGFIKDAKTWFGEWRDWVNYEEPRKKLLKVKE